MKTIFPLLLLLLLFSACETDFEPEPQNNPEAVFEDLWQNFNTLYAPFEERGVDWQEQYHIYRPQVHAQTTDDALFAILSNLLASLDDGHVSLTAPGREVFFSNEIRRLQLDDALFDLAVITDHYLEAGYQRGTDDSYVYGRLKNTNLGYIFFDYVGDNFNVMDEFLDKYKEADGYVIDLRHNQGGDFTYAFPQIGRFTDEKRLVFESKTKNGAGEDDYTDWHTWHLEPRGNYVDKALVVLTDRYTISAGERAVMAFKTLPQVTFVGDTTSGAQGTMIGRELANGWFYSLVPQKTKLYDGQSYEGIGLSPDLYVKNTSAELSSGTDAVLEAGMEVLK
ncbi:S41 family peptidase [Catalinimonas sp. 4WD22]|uniref:S41 family peptidase n=1 Tax=Catalinimonas locisalis TaxID=3133978 RepID=UPI003100CD44